ncbi:hypothetical protein [Albibacillus kandeliae]|uniref:hypothetical protein n=1 Tax=Albibacillus kandeliae TaxID=2174228 RepID=UPI000D688607|nr:hypothetical protein [Albibacillus kandeliae]
MAKNEIQHLDGNGPEKITDGDVVSITAQNQSGVNVLLYPSIGGAAPVEGVGYIILPPKQILVNEALADLFPGVAGVNQLFAEPKNGKSANLYVAHD